MNVEFHVSVLCGMYVVWLSCVVLWCAVACRVCDIISIPCSVCCVSHLWK